MEINIREEKRMSNWCEGTLKVRGKLKDVEQWVKENVSVFHSDFVKDQNGKIKGIEEVKIPDGVKVENSDGEVLEITISEDAYIAETRRHLSSLEHTLLCSIKKLPRSLYGLQGCMGNHCRTVC
ncbi:MAG: hypothetical protein ACLUT1_09160 [Ruminococcus sp.]